MAKWAVSLMELALIIKINYLKKGGKINNYWKPEVHIFLVVNDH